MKRALITIGVLVAGALVALPTQPATAANADVGFWLKMQYNGGSSSFFAFGIYPGDMPVAGDWDRDGRDTIGIHRQSNGKFYLKQTSNVDTDVTEFTFGTTPEDLPIAGDWDGDGRDTVGFFRPSAGTFYLKLTSNFSASTAYDFGMAGDLPVAGDWNGDGKDTIGIFRPSAGKFYLKGTSNSNTAPYSAYDFGTAEDMPVAGDWNGDGKDTIGIHRPSANGFYIRPTVNTGGNEFYGLGVNIQDAPVAGDWDGSGSDTIGIHRENTDVSIAQLQDMFGTEIGDASVVEDGLPSLNVAMQDANITTPPRKAAFLATLLRESRIHYNASEGSGSGYYGRGFIQITGSANYSAASSYFGVDFIGNPDLAKTLSYSAPLARWYWSVARNINPLADALDMGAVDRAIGYYQGLDPEEWNARCARFKTALAYFNHGYLPSGIDCVR